MVYQQNSSQLFYFSFLVFSTVEKFGDSVLDSEALTPHSSCKAFKIDTTLTRLDLSSRMMSDRDVRSLSEDLKVNNMLTSLVLGENNIDDSGAAHLSEALKVNKKLCSLYMSFNNIGDSGAAYLSEARKLNRRLTVDVQDHLGFPLQGNVRSFSKKVIPNSEER